MLEHRPIQVTPAKSCIIVHVCDCDFCALRRTQTYSCFALQAYVCLLLQDLYKSCARGGGVKRGDVCYGMLRAAACVDESDHHALMYVWHGQGDEEVVSQEEGGREGSAAGGEEGGCCCASAIAIAHMRAHRERSAETAHGQEREGGRVLWDATSRGLCGRVGPPRTNVRAAWANCERGGSR